MEDFLEDVTDRYYDPKVYYLVRTILMGILLVALISVFFFVQNLPIKLQIRPKDNVVIYETTDIKANMFEGRVSMLSGSKKGIDSLSSVSTKKLASGDIVVTGEYGSLRASVRIVPVKIKSIDVIYDGVLRYGDALDSRNVRGSLVYEDGYVDSQIRVSCTLPERIKGPLTVPVSTNYGDTVLELVPLDVKNIIVDYNVSPLCSGDLFDPANVKVTISYDDGQRIDSPGFELDLAKGTPIVEHTEVNVHTSYGDGLLVLDPLPFNRLEFVYDDTLYEHRVIENNKLHVVEIFDNEDGSEYIRNSYDWLINGGDGVFGEAIVGSSFTVTTSAGSGVWEPVVVALSDVDVELVDNKPLFSGEVPVPYAFILKYVDNSELRVLAKDLDLSKNDWTRPAVEGENNYTFTLYGYTYNCDVYALPELPVTMAKDKYKTEVGAAGDLSYVDDNTFITIRSFDDGDSHYYLTHVVVDSILQIHGGLSGDEYANGERETPSSAAVRQNWIVGVNASVFDYDTGGLDTNIVGVVIKNGEVMPDSKPTTTGHEVCLKNTGEFFTPDAGLSPDILLSQGVIETFGSKDIVLIQNGYKVNETVVSEAIPRTAIGMVKPGEYYLLTAAKADYAGGMTYDQVRNVFWDLGCTYAKCLDGGGSVSLVFNGSMINDPPSGAERAVVDYLYFTGIPANAKLSTSDYINSNAYTVVQGITLGADDISVYAD